MAASAVAGRAGACVPEHAERPDSHAQHRKWTVAGAAARRAPQARHDAHAACDVVEVEVALLQHLGLTVGDKRKLCLRRHHNHFRLDKALVVVLVVRLLHESHAPWLHCMRHELVQQSYRHIACWWSGHVCTWATAHGDSYPTEIAKHSRGVHTQKHNAAAKALDVRSTGVKRGAAHTRQSAPALLEPPCSRPAK